MKRAVLRGWADCAVSGPETGAGPGAAEMRDGFEAGEEEIDVGEMTRRIAQGLTHDRNAVERLLMSPGRAATAEIFETTI
jgi:hypothetical protein